MIKSESSQIPCPLQLLLHMVTKSSYLFSCLESLEFQHDPLHGWLLTTVLPFVFLLIIVCNVLFSLDTSYFRNPYLKTVIEFEACIILELKPT